MKFIAAACAIAFGLTLGGCANNQPPADNTPPPSAHHMGGKLGGGKLGN